MRSLIEQLPSQLRWSPPNPIPDLAAPSILVCGMGGSGISGDYAALVAGQAGLRLSVHKSFGLPGWAINEKPLVVVVSFSGNTVETLAGFEEARGAGLQIVAVTSGGRLADAAQAAGVPLVSVPGGLPPRASLGLLIAAVLRVIEASGVGDVVGQLEEAADVLDSLIGKDRGAALMLASELVDGLGSKVPVMWAAPGPGVPAALRWKNQINENSKAQAFWSVLPELHHNEIMGWSGDGQFGVLMLRDRQDVPAIVRRFDASKALVNVVGEVWSQGESSLARAMSLSLVGDFVSLIMAERSGVDPFAVDVIEELKQQLEG